MAKTKNEFSRPGKLTSYLTFGMNSANQMRLLELNIVFSTYNISFHHGKKLSEDTRGRILCLGRIIYMHYNTFHICLQTYSNNRIR